MVRANFFSRSLSYAVYPIGKYLQEEKETILRDHAEETSESLDEKKFPELFAVLKKVASSGVKNLSITEIYEINNAQPDGMDGINMKFMRQLCAHELDSIEVKATEDFLMMKSKK